MVNLSTVVILVSSLTAFAAPLSERTLTQVNAAIDTVATDVVDPNHFYETSFPATGGTLTQALAFHMNAATLASALVQGTNALKNIGTVSVADGTTILGKVQIIQPSIIDLLHLIIVKKPAFDGLPVKGSANLVKADLHTLDSDATVFGTGLIAVAPATLKETASAIKANIDSAFLDAIAAYANA